MSDVMEAKAAAVVAHLSKNKGLKEAGVGASPFLDFIMQLFQQLLPILLTCFATPKAAVAALQNPGLGLRIALRLRVGRSLSGADRNMLLAPVCAAILDVAKDCTEVELTEMQAGL